jgi:hypothetical protein
VARLSQLADSATTRGSEFEIETQLRLRLKPSAMYSTTKSRNVGSTTSPRAYASSRRRRYFCCIAKFPLWPFSLRGLPSGRCPTQ